VPQLSRRDSLRSRSRSVRCITSSPMRSSLRSLNQGGALHGACLADGDGDGASCPDNAPLWRSWVARIVAMSNFAITGFYEVRLTRFLGRVGNI
jgi:hypothetical protein